MDRQQPHQQPSPWWPTRTQSRQYLLWILLQRRDKFPLQPQPTPSLPRLLQLLRRRRPPLLRRKRRPLPPIPRPTTTPTTTAFSPPHLPNSRPPKFFFSPPAQQPLPRNPTPPLRRKSPRRRQISHRQRRLALYLRESARRESEMESGQRGYESHAATVVVVGAGDEEAGSWGGDSEECNIAGESGF